MAYYLGVDGGGTKTRCVLANETAVLADAMTGGCSVLRVGEQQARESLHSAIRQVCARAKISPDHIHAVCVGATGAARPEIAAKVRAILAELIPESPTTKIELVGDHVIALEAAFGSRPGVIVIAGTGSIAYGRDDAGVVARAGGWGFAISDEGSGQWLGRRVVSTILDAYDHGLESVLTSMVLEEWKLTTIDELVQHANSTPPPEFPRLFPLLLRAGGQGDPAARGLLFDGGVKLANLAATVVHRLAPPSAGGMPPAKTLPLVPLPIAMTGSVFRQSADVRQAFYNTLQQVFPGIEVRPDLADPIEGALARAKRA
ncbi:MAG: BadF/BadG/BcrA/BcrD ATPase family protein [Terriglobales bacterium]|jgi:N-acetylglucosamine kinase-like BadF-type ATPase